jgi:hypothetical protein
MTELTRTGLNAGITPPVWDGVKPLPRPAEGLAYDWSPMTPAPGDRFEWVPQLNSAKARIAEARTYLDQLDGYAFPADPKDTPQAIRDAVDGARKTVFPKRFDLGHAKGEVPNYLPDGSIHPEDLAASTRLWDKPSLRMHLETVLFRLPPEGVGRMNVAAVDEALKGAEAFSLDITYQTAEGGKDLPSASAARDRLTKIESLIDEALKNAGTDTVDAGLWARIGNRFQQLPVTHQRAAVIGAIGGAAVVTSLVGLGISRAMRD